MISRIVRFSLKIIGNSQSKVRGGVRERASNYSWRGTYYLGDEAFGVIARSELRLNGKINAPR